MQPYHYCPDKYLIVEDHPMFRNALAMILGELDDDIILLEAENLSGALVAGRLNAPLQLILLDLNLSDTTGMQALTECRRNFPITPIVVISVWEMEFNVSHAMSLGANGYISKSTGKNEMLEGISQVLNGEIVIITKPLAAIELSLRQIEILQHIGEGLSNRDIARLTDLSVNTVRDYLVSIMRLLQVSNRTQAAIAAQKLGLLVD